MATKKTLVKPKTATVDHAASLAARIDRLGKLIGDPTRENKKLAYYAQALRDADRALAGRAVRPANATFVARADAFLHAREIAHAIDAKRWTRGDWDDVTSRAAAWQDVESIRRGHVRTASALKYLEQAFFTEWNESHGADVNAFWRAIAKARLPYVRRDLLAEIFERGRIPSREHYEFAIDMLGAEGEPGGITRQQSAALSKMIGAYESRAMSRG